MPTGLTHLAPGPDLLAGKTPTNGLVRVLVPLSALVTDHVCMQDTLDHGRVSETPYAPLLLNVREDATGRYEIADGHHRVARALRDGATHLWADIDPIADDEPYQGPFYDFTRPLAGVAVGA